jgi:transcriptional regulator with XRE-family HTH domain
MQEPPRLSAHLGLVIRRLRHQRGLTIERLAHAGEIEVSYLSGIERGLRKPSLEKIEGIAAVFEMEVSDLVRLAERERHT